jgi:hypothetical protein
VGVPDLLAVINAWGACGSPCPADISPSQACGIGDGAVGVPDLLLVINMWGACPTSPGGGGGGGGGIPTSISDCWTVYCNGLSGGEWQDCINKCVNIVCQEYPEECD